MEWKTAWSYLPLDYGTTIGIVENITQKTIFRNNINGKRVKVKFTNLYGNTPLKLKEVVIAQRKYGQSGITGSVNVTVDNQQEIIILPGQEFYSDEIIYNIKAGTDIVLSVYIEEAAEIQSSCCSWAKQSWYTTYVLGGNYTKIEDINGAKSYEVYPFIKTYMDNADVIAGISEVRLLTEEDVKVITLFGDSITHMSFYSDALIEDLYKRFPGKVTVLNKGLGGNKLLTDASYFPDIPGNGRSSGQAAIRRFERDVFLTETPDFIFMLEGVNDLMHPYLLKKEDLLPTKQEMIEAYMKLVSIAHKNGSKIYLSTILPLVHQRTPFGAEGEKIRNEINKWILKQKESDGVFDFASALAKNSQSMKDELHIGDGLHPNKEGGIVMANVVLQNRR